MANLQSLLMPVSALGNQSSTRLSTSRGALAAQGGRSEAPDKLNDGAFNGERSFSRLLNDSGEFKPEESKKAKALLRGEANLSSSSVPDVLTAKFGPLSGNQLPVEGQVLPLSWSLGLDDSFPRDFKASAGGQSANLQSEVMQSDFRRSVSDGELVATSINGVEVNIGNARKLASKDSLSAFTVDTQAGIGLGLDKNAVLLAEIGDIDLPDNTWTGGQPLPPLNPGSDTEDDLSELIDPKFPEPHLSNMVSGSESNVLNLAQTEPALLVGGSGETEIAFASSQALQDVQVTLNQQQISDASVKSSPLMAMNLPEGIISEEVTQGRSKGVDFLNISDISGRAEDSAAEFSKVEGLISAQGPKGGDKTLPFVVGNSLAFGASPGDAAAVQNHSVTNGTSLANSLSQWRVDQDNTNVANADPLERQGFSKMSVPFNQSGWGENLGKQLSMLLAKNMDSAQIQLDPPELGPLTVKIQINQDQVSLQFTSGHSAVREALEQSSQRLQQMFSDEGLDLVDVGVSDQKRDSDQNEEQGESEPKFGESSVGLSDESDGLLTPVRNVAIDDGNIDYFI
jgi:hypothetical protein|tara:strand:- start:841 stop:2547 length:1707 start_codon:yes stop_codon:yes gene_type:complete